MLVIKICATKVLNQQKLVKKNERPYNCQKPLGAIVTSFTKKIIGQINANTITV